MPYFAPPGGPLTARTARALQDSSMSGLGITPSINVRTQRVIPAAMSAARRYRAEHEPTMTGMGLVRAPRYPARYAAPAPVTFHAARIAAAHAALQGLGAAHAAHPAAPHVFHFGVMPMTGGIQRQAAMFMSPGGGYSQVPGFMPAIGPPPRRLSFLGQEEPWTYTAPTDLTPPVSIHPFIDYGESTPPQQIFLLPTPSTPPEPSTYTAPTRLLPPGAGGAPIGVQNKPVTFLPSVPGAGVPFMQQALLGVKNQYLVAAGVGIILLTVISRKRRRNPARRRRRRAA